MKFSESAIIGSFIRSGGRCECRRDHPEHRGHGRCKVQFSRNDGWRARRVNENAPDTARNCELLCADCFDLAEAGAALEARI